MAKLLSGTRIYGTANVDSTLYVNGTTASTSNTTGALVVAGGVGVTGNVYATGLYDNGIEVLVYAQVVSNVANSATANTIVTQGVDATQNTRLTVIEGTDVSQNVRIDYSNTAITIIQGVDVTQNTRLTVIEGTDVSQNVRLDYSNSAITIIQGVDATQNTNIQTAWNTANNALPNVGPVITVNSSSRLIVSNTTTSTSNTTGALVVNGGVGVAGQLTAQQVVAQNLLATGFVQSPYQIVAPKGMVNTGPVTGSATFYTGTSSPGSYGVACDPTGRFVYITSSANATVSQYSINQTTGALTSITTPIAAGANATGVACDPTGRFVYVTNAGLATVSMYSINQTTGALTSITTAIACNTGPFTLACEPTGRFVYVANYSGSAISQYSINQTTGALTSIGADIAVGGPPWTVTCDPTGRFVYAACTGPGVLLAMYSINQTTGALTSITTAISLPNATGRICCEPTGKFVFAGSDSYTVNTFSINQTTGALTFVGSYIASAGTGGAIYTFTPDPTGKLLYISDNGGTTITPISINPYNGMLYNPQASQNLNGSGLNSFWVTAIDPTGRFLYAAGTSSNLTTCLFVGSFSTGFATFGSITTTGTVTAQNIFNPFLLAGM